MKKNSWKKKVLSLLLVASLSITGLTACGDDSTAKKEDSKLTSVKVGIDAQQLAYVQIVAKEKGYFEKNGIDVELVNYAVGIDTINAIVLGEVQIGAAYDYAGATRLAEKTNLRLVSSFVQNSEDTLWFETSDPDVKTAKDLKGKKIALTKGTLAEYLWAKELESGGLTTDDVEIQNLGSGGEVAVAYVSGKADAIEGEKNFEEQYSSVEGRHRINSVADIGIISRGYIFADKDFVENNQEALEGYYKGLDEALKFIEENKEEAAQIAADYLTLSKGDILNSLNSYKYEVRFSQDDFDNIQNIANWCEENGITGKIDINDYSNLDALKAYVPDKVTYSK